MRWPVALFPNSTAMRTGSWSGSHAAAGVAGSVPISRNCLSKALETIEASRVLSAFTSVLGLTVRQVRQLSSTFGDRRLVSGCQDITLQEGLQKSAHFLGHLLLQRSSS